MYDKLITYDTGLLAKEKGYTLGLHLEYFATTQSLLQKWLREEHDIHIMIGYCEDGCIAQLQKIDPSWSIEIPKFDDYIIGESYEHVLELALVTALNLI
jgi:hypothetical protein